MSRISNRAKVGTYTKFNHKFSLILCLSILPHLLSKPPGESRVSSTTVYLCTRIWILSVAIQVIAATTGLLRSLIPCTREYLASMQHVISFNKETDNPLIKITNSSVVNTPTWHTNPRISTKKMKIQTSAPLHPTRECNCMLRLTVVKSIDRDYQVNMRWERCMN